MQGEIWRRSRLLVAELLGHVESEGEVRLPDLFTFGAGSVPDLSFKTVENTVRDLAAFGAVRVVSRGRDRVAGMTILGLAWLEGELLPDDPGELELAVAELLVSRGIRE